MISYLVEEISSRDLKRIAGFLEEYAFPSKVEGIYWVKVPQDILSRKQYSHPACAPHVCAVELGRDWVKMEFFVRSLKKMRCTCPGAATEQQREFITAFVHGMLDELGIEA